MEARKFWWLRMLIRTSWRSSLWRISLPSPQIYAIQHFKGDRNIDRVYSDRPGDISRPLRELRITADNCQLGVPQHNAVAERLVQYVHEGTRKVLVRV